MPKQPDHTKAVEHLKNADPKLAALIAKVGPCLMKQRHEHSIFYALMRSIVYQQLAGAAASAIMGRLDGLFGGYQGTPEQVMSLPDERLRGVGLSQNKLLAIRDLAEKTLDGTVPSEKEMPKLSDDEIIERCVKVRGIGRWTVEMLLIFRLGRGDVLPVDDYGVRKGIQFTYRMRELPKKAEMQKRAKKWHPYCSVASWYFWRACEMAPRQNNKKTAKKAAVTKTSAKKSVAKKTAVKKTTAKKTVVKNAAKRKAAAK